MSFWLSGPRLFNGLVRPGISFSDRELAAWGKKAPKVSEDATLGVCRRPNGDFMLAIPNMNGTNEHAKSVSVAAFFFSRVDDAIEVRTGTLQRLGGRVGADNWITDKSLGQITQAIRTEAAALGIVVPWAGADCLGAKTVGPACSRETARCKFASCLSGRLELRGHRSGEPAARLASRGGGWNGD